MKESRRPSLSLASPGRRRLIQRAGGLAAAASASALLPPNLRRVMAAEAPRSGSLQDIKHVVILMQENRSFDHYFGTLPGVRGFGDATAMTLASGRSVFHQPDPDHPDGFLLPFHLDTLTTSAQKIPTTNHSWKVQHAAYNHGGMDNWVPAHRKADGAAGPYTMGYYARADIPFHFALAEAFTLCDGYHSSLMGPTWPNRMYLMTGTIDPDGRGNGPITSNRRVKGGYQWTTYPERLQQAGVSWKVYQQEDNFSTNVLEYFANYMAAEPGHPLYERAMVRGPAGQFEDDARHDRLPTVSWVLPQSFESEHPSFMPAAGAAFISRTLDAIAANPDVWAKTVFILNYDENDGLFDHVAPPVPPAGTPSEFIDGEPIGAGFRVPCIVVSPWTTGGWVCSSHFDHTSVLQLLEKVTGVQEPNITPWRRATFGDLTEVFRFDASPAQAPHLPDFGPRLTEAMADVATLPPPTLPGIAQRAPLQEPTGQAPRKT